MLVCLDLQNPELPIEDDEPVAVDDVPPPPPPLTNYKRPKFNIKKRKHAKDVRDATSRLLFHLESWLGLRMWSWAQVLLLDLLEAL